MQSKTVLHNLFKVTFLSLVVFIFNIIIAPDTFAAPSMNGYTSVEDLLPKIHAYNFNRCYKEGYLAQSVKLGASTIMNSSNSVSVYYPNNTTQLNSKYSCKKFFKLIEPDLGSSNNSKAAAALKRLGYEPDNSASNEKFITFTYTYVDANGNNNGESTITVNAVVDSSGSYKNLSANATGDSNGFNAMASGSSVTIQPPAPSETGGALSVTCAGNKWDDLTKCLKDNLNDTYQTTLTQDFLLYEKKGAPSETTQSGTVSDKYKPGNFNKDTVRNNYFGAVSVLTNNQKVTLYQSYLNKYASVICTDNSERGENLTGAGGYTKFHGANINGSGKSSDNCYAKGKDGIPSKFNDAVGTEMKEKQTTFADMLKALTSINSKTSDVLALQADSDIEGSEGEATLTEGEGQEESWCFQEGGALGWIVCPIISAIHDALEKVYTNIMERFLQAPAAAFAENSDSLRAAWGIFQNLANVTFVILILIVIISQLTGVGIDNYGIKKILPKIILAAILINLSYIICQLVVDASNILGSGIKRLLDSYADQITPESSGVGPIQKILAPTGAIGAIIAVGGVGIAASGAGFAVLLPILISGLSAFLAIFFMFVLLIARQAGIILLVVISPIAFACYMLPNTKRLFDKWFNLFKALLLLYPLCGLVIGAGGLAGAILSQTNDDWIYQVAAMVLSVIPFFFIPTLLRSSLNAMGNLGSKISGLSRGVQGKVRGAKNTDAYKRANTKMRAIGVNSRYGLRNGMAKTKLGKALGTQTRMAQYSQAAEDLSTKDRTARGILTRNNYAARIAKGEQIGRDELEQDIMASLRSGDTEQAIAQANYAVSRIGASKGAQLMRSVLESAENDDDFLNDKKGARSTFLMGVDQQHGQALASKDFALGRTLSSGGRDVINGTTQSTKSLRLPGGLEANAMKNSQIASLNKSSISDMHAAGQISQAAASEILSNQSLSSGLDNESRAYFQQIADGAAPGTTLDANYQSPASARSSSGSTGSNSNSSRPTGSRGSTPTQQTQGQILNVSHSQPQPSTDEQYVQDMMQATQEVNTAPQSADTWDDNELYLHPEKQQPSSEPPKNEQP